MTSLSADVAFARRQAPFLLQEVRRDWDRPRAFGFADPIETDKPPLYWWLRDGVKHTFVGYCIWYDQDPDHPYDFTGCGYWIPKTDQEVNFSWCREHFDIRVMLHRRPGFTSTEGKHSIVTAAPRAPWELIQDWQIDEKTCLDHPQFRENAEWIQAQMGEVAQLPENWVDIKVRNYQQKFFRRCQMDYGVKETRGLLFTNPHALLDIKLRIGDIKKT